jgi:hypothetical protein
MTDQTTATAPTWRPSERAARSLMLYLGYCVLIIGAIALALSFVSVDQAARPYFGAASWAIPVLMDTTIGVLTFFSIVAELNGLRAPLARLSARALVGLTVYANIAPQHAVYGKILHGAPPVVWVIVVAVAEGLIRRLAGLADGRRIEAVRRSLWLLRPVATWRLWRAMRIHEIRTYAGALDRDAARAAVVGRLRLHHGRMWRAKAPLSERIALRLQGRDPAGVAQVLGDHATTVALLAGTATAPVPDTAPEPSEGSALMPLDPIVYPAGKRPVLFPFPVPNAQRIPFQPLKALTARGEGLEAAGNDARSDENERDVAIRMRADGSSFGEIADRLGRSKSWAYRAAGDVPIGHANGSSAS